MTKKKKASKRKKIREICLDSPTDSQENGEDDYAISSGFEKMAMDGLDNGVVQGTLLRVPSRKRPKSDSSGKHKSSSSSSSDEGSARSNGNLSKGNVGESAGSNPVSEPILRPIKRGDLAAGNVKVVSEATPGTIGVAPIEKPEIIMDSSLNSGVSAVAEAKVIKNSDCSEAAREKQRESVDPGSLRNEETHIVSAVPQGRPTTWKCCCGLFELLTGADR